ncbi:Apoptotic protease-activating factor 1 [Zootermopsis nevadensis]|uniref:Apoptotic protease-activating factor 1 n=3 Tax=Zootermopsis nevadensis TaxID=136037 RepID=A0A067RHV5_ZOONE|nr:Apoptotic protease-activating factor 1 [Zootermopsis nevadensis]
MDNIKYQEFGHSTCTSYTCAAMSQDLQFIIVGASDCSISIWSVEEGTLVKDYQNHNGQVRCLDTFCVGNCQLFLSGLDDNTIKIWLIELTETEQKSKLQQNFDVLWDRNSSDPCIHLLAAPDNNNKVQLLQGRSIVTETDPEKGKVKSCKLSDCGQFLLYGCCDGSVKMFEIKSKSTSVIIKLSGAVHYLQVSSNSCSSTNSLTVIAGGEDSSLKIWRGKPNTMGLVITCAGQTDVVVQCFIMSMGQKLLSCAQDGSVKIWDILTGRLIDVLVGRYTDVHVTMADLSSNEDLLVLCGASGSFLLIRFTVLPDEPYVKVQGNYNYQLRDSLRSCKLSHDACLLALGQDTGNIVIWDVQTKVILDTLKLHKTGVQNLLFSPPASAAGSSLVSLPPIILLSVGDQIGWWDVGRLTMISCGQRRKISSGQRRRKQSGDSPKLPLRPVDDSFNGCARTGYLAGDWLGKRGQEETLLLGCVKLLGPEVKKVSASSNFAAFTTVDASGIVYLMKILQ